MVNLVGVATVIFIFLSFNYFSFGRCFGTPIEIKGITTVGKSGDTSTSSCFGFCLDTSIDTSIGVLIVDRSDLLIIIEIKDFGGAEAGEGKPSPPVFAQLQPSLKAIQ